ncbi:sulfotransferase [Paenibacillus sp. KN14-4R]|uniref:sulfotransferase n=1 Tax=Paenibacillus sp. KN14-4R TaxID=3445773 RepID=UPI003FA1515A
MDIVILGVTQRTGSTLVQRIFNSRKQTLIWGEQGGILKGFTEFRKDLEHFSTCSESEKQNYFGRQEDPNTWIANMTPDHPFIHEAIIEGARTMLQALYVQHRNNHDRIGFKEVRYGRDEIELLKMIFPQMIIILLVRHPVDIWRSEKRYWASDIKKFAATWNKHAHEYWQLQNDANSIYLFRYEDINNREEHTLHMLSKLADVSVEDIQHVLSVQLNSTSRRRTHKEIQAIRQYCSEGMNLYGYE